MINISEKKDIGELAKKEAKKIKHMPEQSRIESFKNSNYRSDYNAKNWDDYSSQPPHV